MIIVAGEALVDRIVQPDGSSVDRPGGGPYNTARTIARMGVPAAFLGSLSSDDAGRRLRDGLSSDGVDLSFALTTKAPTTVAVASLDAAGVASYRFETDGTSAAQLSAAAVAAALATRPSALHVGTLGMVLEPIATVLAAAAEALARPALLMLDPNCRAPAIVDRPSYLQRLLRVLRRVDIVKTSRDDLDFLWPGMPSTVAAHRMLATGPSVVVITDGPNPVTAMAAGWSFELDTPRVPVIDTFGAGDAFGGALLARWIECGYGRTELGDPSRVRESVQVAAEVAGRTCTRAGADPPHRAEVVSLTR